MHSFTYDRTFAIAQTTEGPVRGFEHDRILTFRGIPYAQARRFHAPEPAEKHEDILDATSYGYVCPLLSQEKPKGEIYVPHRYWLQSEDCLNLNIWTPALDGARRPVMFWMHGGGYSAGSAIEHIAYDGHAMALNGDVVVVTVNHRLNLLGYLDLSAYGKEYENSGNAGGDDLIAALKWVHENIAGFGGGPENVVIFGQSGGGGKVTTLLQSPAADGLYAKGYVMSGVIGMLGDPKGEPQELAEALMEKLGVNDVAGLERVPYAALAKAYEALAPAFRKAGKYLGCLPTPNAHYLGDPLVHGFRPETSQVPLLIGTVLGEFTSFAPGPFDKHVMTEEKQRDVLLQYIPEDTLRTLETLYRACYPERPLLDLVRVDTLFREPTIAYIRTRAALNSSTYSYLFAMDQPVFGGLAPWHCSDIPYVFHNIDLVDYPNGSPDASAMQEMIFRSVMAFARTGDPANDLLPAWPACTPECESTMLLDASPKCAENFDHQLIPAVRSAFAPAMARIMKDLSGQAQH